MRKKKKNTKKVVDLPQEQETDYNSDSDRVEELPIFECGRCGELHDEMCDAEICCQPQIEELDGFRCTECLSLYKEREDAEDCCPQDD